MVSLTPNDYSTDYRDKCSEESGDKFEYPQFFQFSNYDIENMRSKCKEGESSCPAPMEKTFTHCCPTMQIWLKFREMDLILTENKTITEDYRKVFEECRTKAFINYGDPVIQEELKGTRQVLIIRCI